MDVIICIVFVEIIFVMVAEKINAYAIVKWKNMMTILILILEIII